MALFLYKSPTPNIESNYPQFFDLGILCYHSISPLLFDPPYCSQIDKAEEKVIRVMD